MGCMNCNGPVLHPTPWNNHLWTSLFCRTLFLWTAPKPQVLQWTKYLSLKGICTLHKTFETGTLVVGGEECANYLFDLQSIWSRRQPRDCVWGGETPSNLSTWWVSILFNTNKFNYSLREDAGIKWCLYIIFIYIN